MSEEIRYEPLVSVITIFLNEEKFIEEAIASVFAQTYTQWELLLVDDGSTDESTRIAQNYAAGHSGRIRYLEHDKHENRGMSATRNLGIRQARGEYIAFLDADDVWLPLKLEQQVRLMEKHPGAAMLYGRTQLWFSWTAENPFRSLFALKQNDPDPLTIPGRKYDRLIEPPSQLLLHLQDRNIYPTSCSVLVRRPVFEEVGFFEEQFRNANEDMVFHSKVFLKYPVYVSSRCWDRYRIHPDSFWRTAWREGRGKETEQSGRLNYLIWLENYLQEQEITDPRVWKKLNRAFFPYEHPRLFRWQRTLQYPFDLSVRMYRRLKNRLPWTSIGHTRISRRHKG